jgi:hypothetical protein
MKCGDADSFASEVNLLIDTLSNVQFYCKKENNNNSKKLREELHPLSLLGLYLKQPRLNVEVKAFEDDGPADGHIRITGLIEREFEVQITFAGYGYPESLRDELFVLDGFTPLAGDIKREKSSKNITATMAAVDTDEHIYRIAAAIREVFLKKESIPYAPGTVLLIAFDEIKLSGSGNWQLLFAKLDQDGGFADSQFDEIYLVNCGSYELHKVT